MKFTNSWLGNLEINSKTELESFYKNFKGKIVEDLFFAEDEKGECPKGYNFLLQLKFENEDGYWTIGYTDVDSV